MNLKNEMYSLDVGKMACFGIFIAYLIGDKGFDNPIARVLFKPYIGLNTNTMWWIADKIYGTASESFRIQAQNIINKIQGIRPPMNDLYIMPQNILYDSNSRQINLLTGIDNQIYDNPSYIQNIDDPPETLQMIAVTKQPLSIKHIKHPTDRVQFKAVSYNKNAIKYINNPTDEVLEIVRKRKELMVI